jgi:flagellar hook protein FlgE
MNRPAGKGVHCKKLLKGKIMVASTISSGLAGLESNQRALDISARNIAAETLQTQSTDQAGGANNVTISAQGRALAGSGSGSSTDLATEITNSLIYKASFDLSAKLVKVGDETLGSLIDIRA